MVLSGLVMMSAPVVALAQVQIQSGGACSGLIGTGTTQGGVKEIICRVGDILSTIVPVLMVLAIIYFVWGVINYVIASDEEAKKAGRDRIIYGVIGLAVIVGVWGLVKIVQDTFGFDNTNTNPIVLPTIDIYN